MKKNVFTILAIVIATMLMTGCNAEEKNLRLLHWNIQNGMWDGQNDNYDRFLDEYGIKTLFPYAAICVGISFVTMLFVRHGDSKPLVRKSGIEALDVD